MTSPNGNQMSGVAARGVLQQVDRVDSTGRCAGPCDRLAEPAQGPDHQRLQGLDRDRPGVDSCLDQRPDGCLRRDRVGDAWVLAEVVAHLVPGGMSHLVPSGARHSTAARTASWGADTLVINATAAWRFIPELSSMRTSAGV